MCIVLSPELWNTSTFFVTTTYTCAGDSQSRACPLWTIPHFRTIHGVLEVMTEFFLACSRPPYPQECAHQTQRDEFLLADENVAHTHADDHGATKVSRRKHSTAQVLLNASTSVGSGTVRNKPIPASMQTTSEPPKRPVCKCSGSMSLESDVPPKRLKLGPLKGWGVERDGVSMNAVEYAQKHWSGFRVGHPEMLNSILPDDIQVE
ncbi:hypothetical protein C8J57DRAFT_1248568 [Mycena rebaudengoi]|nr:hypothetical protein C8J57DRAFT_1248568 [Mycena rebaudengoi]